MTKIINAVLNKRDQFILVLMLELLHLSIWLDFGSLLSRSLMLSHLGLFLLWQPVWKNSEKLRWDYSLLFITLTILVVYWLNPWILFVWLVLLIGFVSGRVITIRGERAVFMIVVIFLVSQLLIGCITMLAKVDTGLEDFFRIMLPILPVFILFLPAPPRGSRTQYAVDLLHSISASMLAGLVAMGSLLNMFLSDASYTAALIQTSVVIGLCIIFISWLLTAQSWYSGFTRLWLNSLLNIGTPFELWITELSIHAEKQPSADDFLDVAMQELANFEWISGVEWRSPTASGSIGEPNANALHITEHDLNVKLFTYGSTGGVLKLHCHLLTKLVYNLYIGKIREKELAQQSYLKAIYETGSRITHDIKNLLQSLHAITSLTVADAGDVDHADIQKLLKRQLPSLTQRLQLALDKLQTPLANDNQPVYLKDWWRDVNKRNAAGNIEFEADINADPLIPLELFDSVIDNLSENFSIKSQNHGNLSAKARLVCKEKKIKLEFSDNGQAIPADIAGKILKEPLDSDSGLGIGLYQAAAQAKSAGYELVLTDNRDGNVCFALSKR